VAGLTEVTNSGQRKDLIGRFGRGSAPRLSCSTRSAEVLLIILILISLNIVACYDAILSRIVRFWHRLRRPASMPSPISSPFTERTHPFEQGLMEERPLKVRAQ
jgi:hypothetical protein